MGTKKKIIFDVKTGKKTVEEIEANFTPAPDEPKGLDLQKVKQVLLNKGIITNFSEVE